MNNPLMSNPVLRRMIDGKNLIHVYLLSPHTQEEENATFTLVYVDGRWLVVPGLYGEPKRIFQLRIADALELQKQLFAGMAARRLSEWIKIARWYVKWRKKVEVPLP